MALKTRHDFPPLGFTYFQPQTGWTSPAHIGFGPTVDAIITHRKSNPRFGLATDRASVEAELDAYTESRLRAQYGAQADMWLSGPPVMASPAPPSWAPLRARPGVPSAAAGVAKTSAVKVGIGLIRDFLGATLKAVPRALAEKRASVCVTCPQNQKGGLVAHLGGEGLKLMLQARTDLKLETSFDDRLFDCAVCTCSLHLKPHIELAYILEKTPPDVMQNFPSFCWIAKRDQD